MRLNSLSRLLLMSVATTAVASPAFATFHLMQIEQVIGGVNGDMTLQAIQLRMRGGGQNMVQNAQIRAFDAAGANPVLIINIPTMVATATAGSRVLITTAAFATAFSITPDFVMTNPIPPAYLAAGKLGFELDGGAFTFWALAWGGAGYTGTNTGTMDNDADGNFNPPFAGALPSGTGQALQFPGLATAMSTNNAADYAVTAGNATFTNNAGQSTTVPVELQNFKVE
jgi:hypothetical protein